MVVSLGLEVGYRLTGALVLRVARLRLQCPHHVCDGVLAAAAGTGHYLRDVAVELCRYAEGALYSLADNRRSKRRHVCYWRHLCAVFLPLFDCRQRSWSVFGLARFASCDAMMERIDVGWEEAYMEAFRATGKWVGFFRGVHLELGGFAGR